MPGSPADSDAACLPVCTPSPAASQPMRRTPGSGRKAWNRPIAFDPPPTHAIAVSGSRPVRSRICRRAPPDHSLEIWIMAGNGWGPATVPKM